MNVADTLRDLEQELFKVSVRTDAVRVADLLAEEFREFGSSGRMFTKAEIIEALRDEALRDEVPAAITMQDFRLVSLTDHLALVTYRAIKVQDGVAASASLRSSLWRLDAGDWRMVFHQGTKVLDAIV
ncbi:MAG: DUF4440 domain-containing protein [Janthinobacterium lividum]